MLSETWQAHFSMPQNPFAHSHAAAFFLFRLVFAAHMRPLYSFSLCAHVHEMILSLHSDDGPLGFTGDGLWVKF